MQCPVLNRLMVLPTLVLMLGVMTGCAAMPDCPQSDALETNGAQAQRHLLAAFPGGSVATPAPVVTFSTLEVAQTVPAGATRLDFFSRKPDGPLPAAPNKVWFRDGQSFELTFVPASSLTVLDADAADGRAIIGVPDGNWQGFIGTTGKPGGFVDVLDPTFYLRDSIDSTTTKPVYRKVGVRALPQPPAWGKGDYKLSLKPAGLETGFVMFWAPTSAQPATPIL